MGIAGRHSTIRTSLFALVLATALPLAGVVGWLLVSDYRHAREVAISRTRTEARHVAARIDSHLAALASTMAIMAARPAVAAMDPARCDPALGEYVRLHPQFPLLALVDAAGRVACSTHAGTPDRFDAARNPWLAAALAAPGFSATDGVFGTQPGSWNTIATHPVRSADGAPAGLVLLPLDLRALGERMLDDVPADVLVGVIDRSNRYLARSRQGEDFTGRTLAPHLASAFATPDREGAFTAEGPDGVRRTYAWVTIERTGWRVAAGLDEDAFVADSRGKLLASAALFAALLAAVLVVTRQLARAIAGPIQGLARTAGRLADGDESARAEPAALREIDEVGRQVNRMIDSQASHRDALLASERRFRELVENVPGIAVQGYDRDRRVTFWNDASAKLYGWTPAEALGRRLEDLIIPAGMRADVIALHAKWVAGGPGIPAGELVLRRKDGSPVAVFSSHAMRPDARGEPEMYCIDVDLTPLKRAEAEIARWRERYRAAIVASGQIIREWEPLGDRHTVSGDTRRILGCPPDEFAGPLARWRDRLHPDDLPRFDAELARSREDGTPFRLECRLLRRDGEWISVVDDGYFVRDAAGGIDCLVSFVVDVTAQRRTEAKSREQLEELRRWHAAMIGRESRLIEMKREVNALRARLGEAPRYPSAAPGDGEAA